MSTSCSNLGDLTNLNEVLGMSVDVTNKRLIHGVEEMDWLVCTITVQKVMFLENVSISYLSRVSLPSASRGNPLSR